MASHPSRLRVPRILAAFVSRELARRDLALDAFRGLMILGMILVNHPGASGAVYPPLQHAAWTGWTLADVIFPGFLFAVGISIRFAMADGHGAPRPIEGRLVGKILRRFAILILLNLVLINFPYYTAPLRLNGTLALIAWCYLLAALIYLVVPSRLQVLVVAALLAVQWLVMVHLAPPGIAPGTMTPEANSARYLDEVLFARVFGPAWIVEGDELVVLHGVGLPLLGSVSTTLIGVLAGQWLGTSRPLLDRLSALFAFGFVLMVAGSAEVLLPVSKILWTGSYVLLMAGIAAQLLALSYWLADHCGYRAWATALQVAGANALFIYVLAQSLQRVLVYGRVHPGGGASERLRQFVFEHYFAPWVSGEAGALVFAVIFLAVCYAVVALLYRRRIFFKL